MAHGFLGDPRDHGRNEVGVDAPGFRASRMSSLSASHGVDEHEKGVGEFGFPRLMAFRAAGDPSRDQHPLPPPRNLALQRERDQAQSLGTSHGDLHRHFEIPQPQGVRVRQWWEDEKFDCWPVGQDKVDPDQRRFVDPNSQQGETEILSSTAQIFASGGSRSTTRTSHSDFSSGSNQSICGSKTKICGR